MEATLRATLTAFWTTALGWRHEAPSSTHSGLATRVVHELVSGRYFGLVIAIVAVENISIVVVVATPVSTTIVPIVAVVVLIVTHGRKFFKLALFLLILILVVVLAPHILLDILLVLPLSAHKAIGGRITSLVLIVISLRAVVRVVMARRTPVRHIPLVLFEVSLHLIHLCWV